MAKGLPNYRCNYYRQMSPVWRYLRDVFDGSEAWLGRDEQGNIHITEKAKTYLPKWASENDKNYLARLASTNFEDRFAQAVRDFVAMILINGIQVEAPDQVKAHFSDLMDNGSPFEEAIRQLAIAALRDGHTFTLIDYPTAEEAIRTEADFQRSGRRPYWVQYDALSVINWKTEKVAGREQLRMVVLAETVIDSASDFEEVEVEQYRVLRPGSWELWRVEKDQQGKEKAVQLDGGLTSLNFIPLACHYGGLKQRFFKSKPPLKALADLNIAHYQTRSDHRTKIHKCSLPVPVLKDSMRPDNEPLVIGPDSFIHLRDPNGSFFWAEPLATSLISSRQEVQDCEAAMDILSASYLLNPSDRQSATATQAQTLKLESSLQGFADQFATGASEALNIHASYLRLPANCAVKLVGDVVREKGRDSQMLLAMSNLPEKDLLSKQAFLEWLKDQQYYESLDVGEEIRRTGEKVDLEKVTNFIAEPA
jgi:hypothetical protein